VKGEAREKEKDSVLLQGLNWIYLASTEDEQKTKRSLKWRQDFLLLPLGPPGEKGGVIENF